MKQKTLMLTILSVSLTLLAFGQPAKGGSKKTAAHSSGKKVMRVTTLTDSVMAPGKAAKKDTLQRFIPNLFESSLSSASGIRLNPRAVSFVQDYMEENGEDLLKMKGWARPYFNMMDAVLTRYSLPAELKYLAVIESQLKSSAVSWAGAVGPWQFMPETARTLGLKVNRKVDERKDFIKSTHAAAKYLRDLYSEFGDWLLVIAAYNGGPVNVYSAIKKSKSRNFWDLQRYLPNETRNHVKKFIGTHYVFEGQGGITTLTKAETTEQLSAVSNFVASRNLSQKEMDNVKTMKISGKYHSEIIARIIAMDINEFNRYNPNFDKVIAAGASSYELKLPAEKMEVFVTNKYQILNESVQYLLSGGAVCNDPVQVRH